MGDIARFQRRVTVNLVLVRALRQIQASRNAHTEPRKSEPVSVHELGRCLVILANGCRARIRTIDRVSASRS